MAGSWTALWYVHTSAAVLLCPPELKQSLFTQYMSPPSHEIDLVTRHDAVSLPALLTCIGS
jgi:hypothetical protein